MAPALSKFDEAIAKLSSLSTGGDDGGARTRASTSRAAAAPGFGGGAIRGVGGGVPPPPPVPNVVGAAAAVPGGGVGVGNAALFNGHGHFGGGGHDDGTYTNHDDDDADGFELVLDGDEMGHRNTVQQQHQSHHSSPNSRYSSHTGNALDSVLFSNAYAEASVTAQSRRGGQKNLFGGYDVADASLGGPSKAKISPSVGGFPSAYEGYSLEMGDADLKKSKPIKEIPEKTYDRICRAKIGSGKFCLRLDCSTRKHQDADKQKVKPGDLVLAQSTNVAYGQPVVPAGRVQTDLKRDLLDDKMFGDDWCDVCRRIDIAFDHYGGMPVSRDTLERAKEMEMKALSHSKTPFKKARTDGGTILGLGAIDEEPFVVVDFPKIPESKTADFQLKTMAEQVEILAENDRVQSQLIGKLAEQNQAQVKDSKKAYEEQGNTNLNFEARLNKMESENGTKDKDMPGQFADFPTLWGTVSALSGTVADLEAKTGKSANGGTSPEVEAAVKNLEQAVERLQRSTELQENRNATGLRRQAAGLDNLSKALSETISALHERVVSLEMTGVSTNSTARPSVGVNGSTSLSSDEILTLFQGVRDELHRLGNLSKKDNVKFHGLGFNGERDASLWLEKNAPEGLKGCLVDPLALFHFMAMQLKGNQTLDQLQKHLKLNIKSFNEAFVITSFGISLPVLFCLDGMDKPVMTREDSFCDVLTAWSLWNNPITGYRKQYTETLTLVVKNLHKAIHTQFGHDTPAAMLCIAALGESQACVQSLFNFIDEYMRKLTESNFDEANAFHLTTRLVKKFLTTLAEPRLRVQNEMTNDLMAREKLMFWSSLQCLEVASGFKKYDYTNDSLIAGELVEFLTTNTGFSRIELMEEELKEARAEIKLHKAAASNAESKADKLAATLKTATQSFEAFQKETNRRLSKLETKK
jgi:hypothetical protein